MKEKINLLSLSDDTITLYSLVRHMGLINQYNPEEKEINDMLEGAGRINSFGREAIKPESEYTYMFELTSLQWAYFQRILADTHLNYVFNQIIQTGGLTQGNIRLLWDGHFADTK